MAKLPENAPVVYWDGGIIRPGDELPDELQHLSDPEVSEVGPESGGGQGASAATEVNGVPVNPEFDADKATVPQLRAELERLKVEFSQDDRKDALKAAYLGATHQS